MSWYKVLPLNFVHGGQFDYVAMMSVEVGIAVCGDDHTLFALARCPLIAQ